MGKKLETRPLPAGWKAFKLPCANCVAYQNVEYKLIEFDYTLVCSPGYRYPAKPEKRNIQINGYQIYLNEKKGNNKRMAEVAAGWKLLTQAEQNAYNARAAAQREQLKAADKAGAPAAGAAEPKRADGATTSAGEAEAKRAPPELSMESDDESGDGSD